jgi:hypothetical protein
LSFSFSSAAAPALAARSILLLSRIVSNPSSSHLTEDPTELTRERRESVDAVDIRRREEPAGEAFDRTEEGRGVVAGLLRAESTENLLSLAALLLLLLFPLTEKAAPAVAALVGAPKLGPAVFAPPTNTELVVLPLLTFGRRMVQGNPNPKILRAPGRRRC